MGSRSPAHGRELALSGVVLRAGDSNAPRPHCPSDPADSRRTASVVIPGFGGYKIEPIKDPVTGKPHRARIVLPEGFEYNEAEMGNSVSFKGSGGAPLSIAHENTYAQLNAFDWSNVS